ncbi:uncharacterized protein [Typha angustifolia]|uniref:uncharacterized protein n=1 Tax=Typha angustifolia TaxID=59011 RepID=UPI003C2F3D8F
MSRCFPFPPPGYETRPRSNHIDLLLKEKLKEKKRKKEKREKEKRDGKHRRGRKHRKEKHKEKKYRNGKHKDKKTDKGGNGNRNRTSAENTEKQTNIDYGEILGTSSWRAMEVKRSRIINEVGRRVRDEESGAANQMVKNFTGSSGKSFESLGVPTAMEKERVAHNKMVSNSLVTTQGNDGTEQQINKKISNQRTETVAFKAAKQKGIGSSHEKVLYLNSTTQRGIGEAGQLKENSMVFMQRRSSGRHAMSEAELKRDAGNGIISSPKVTMQRTNDGVVRQAGRFSSSVDIELEGMGSANVLEKENAGNKILPNHFITDHRSNDRMGTENSADRRVEGLEKKGEADNGQRNRDIYKDWDDKEKNKDKGKHEEKKKEKKTKEKGRHKNKEHGKTRDSSNNNQMDNLYIKALTLQNNNGKSDGTDEDLKKRKDYEMNGSLYENDVRPSKYPRIPPSNAHSENRRKLHLHTAIPSSIKPNFINNIKAERHIDDNGCNVNGTAEAQCSSTDLRPPVSVAANENGDVFAKPSLLDSKYLRQVYSVPNMEVWSEYENEDWLFNSSNFSTKPTEKFEEDETFQVWAQALRIESADVFALPYVTPF